MRSVMFAIGLPLAVVISGHAFGVTPAVEAQPAKPTAYALVAAMGDEFSVVTEEFSTGSRLRGTKRDRIKVPDNLLNRLALQSLEKVVSQADPLSSRVYLTLSTPVAEKIAAMRNDDDIASELRMQLAKLPQRAQWDMILVATPAYQRFDHVGMADKLQGFGIVTMPLTGGSFFFPGATNEADFSRQHRADVVTPDNKTASSKTYAAPYAYIEVWVLDARDMSVLSRQKQLNSKKLADPNADTLDVNTGADKTFLSRQMVKLIEGAVRQALVQSDVSIRRGTVEISDVKVVNP